MLFRSVPIAETVYASDRLPAAALAYPLDSLTLGWEERMKTRARRSSDGGVEFGTALTRGTVLRQGDAFVLDTLPLVVTIRELSEAVFVIRPQTAAEWALWSYHIGNSHQPLMIADASLVCLDIPGVEQMLTYYAIPFARDTRPFTPVSQAPGHHEAR
jgi:urease accessory protein